MSSLQFHQQHQQWREESDEAERIEAANQALQELRDDEFRQEIENKYPQLRAMWPGRQS